MPEISEKLTCELKREGLWSPYDAWEFRQATVLVARTHDGQLHYAYDVEMPKNGLIREELPHKVPTELVEQFRGGTIGDIALELLRKRTRA